VPRYGFDLSFGLTLREKGYLVYADLGLFAEHVGRNVEVWPSSEPSLTNLYYRIMPSMEDFYRAHTRHVNPELGYLIRTKRLNVGRGIKPFKDPNSVNHEWDGGLLPFKDAQFDLVYGWHVPEDGIQELLRVSRDRVELWTDQPVESLGWLYPFRQETEYLPSQNKLMYMTAWHKN